MMAKILWDPSEAAFLPSGISNKISKSTIRVYHHSKLFDKAANNCMKHASCR